MPEQENISSQDVQRPTGIKILSYLSLVTGLYHLLKISQVLLKWPTLIKLSLAVHPLYLAADGLVWSCLGLILAWGLWTGKRWSSLATKILSVLYGVVFWVDRFWIAEPEGLAQRWPINLLLTIIGLGMVYLILSRKSNRDYFQKNPAKIP